MSTKSGAGKRSRSESPEKSDSDSEGIQGMSEDDSQSQAKSLGRKKARVEASQRVQSALTQRLNLAPEGSIGLPAVRALLAKSGSSITKHTATVKETNSGLRKANRPETKTTGGSGLRKASKGKGREPPVRLGHLYFFFCDNRPLTDKKAISSSEIKQIQGLSHNLSP